MFNDQDGCVWVNVSSDKRPLNGCACVCVCVLDATGIQNIGDYIYPYILT